MVMVPVVGASTRSASVAVAGASLALSGFW